MSEMDERFATADAVAVSTMCLIMWGHRASAAADALEVMFPSEDGGPADPLAQHMRDMSLTMRNYLLLQPAMPPEMSIEVELHPDRAVPIVQDRIWQLAQDLMRGGRPPDEVVGLLRNVIELVEVSARG